jgi:hypothetical protein
MGIGLTQQMKGTHPVIARPARTLVVAIRIPGRAVKENGLPRRFAPRNDSLFSAFLLFMSLAE